MKIGEMQDDGNEKDKLRAIASKLYTVFIDLCEIPPDISVLKSIPRNVSENYKVIAIAREENVISLAMVNPLDIFALDEIKMITGCTVKPLLASESDILMWIEKGYS